MKKVLNIVIPVVISAALFYVFLRMSDPKELWNNMKQADFSILGVTIGIALLAHFIRGLRWTLLLKTLGYKASPRNAFLAVMTAYFGNIFIPRAGELMRCVVLNKSDEIPINSGFATVVAERVIDFLCLLSLIAFALIMEYDRFMLFINEKIFKANPDAGGSNVKLIILGIGIVGLLITFLLRKQLQKVPLIKKVLDFVFSIFSQAYQVTINMKSRGLFFLYTILIWIGYYLMTYLVFFALPETSHLGMMAGLVILIAGGLGMSAPSSGGVGTFHIIVAAGLTLFYGISENVGVTYAAVLHTSQLLTMLIIGGICAFIAYYVIGNKKGEETKTESSK